MTNPVNERDTVPEFRVYIPDPPTAVLFTGSREWTHRQSIIDAFNKIPSQSVIIHGDCPTGSDKIVDEIANARSMRVIPMPYFSWLGKRGGPERNRAMVHTLAAYHRRGYTCSVWAFPLGESPGTRHCIQMAKSYGFEVHEPCEHLH